MVARSITRSSQALQGGRGFGGRTEKAVPARGMLDRGLAAVHLLLSPHDRIWPSFGANVCQDLRVALRALLPSRRHGAMLFYSCKIFLTRYKHYPHAIGNLPSQTYKLPHM